ncbi:MAG: YitT family protein [Lachnospiraceae bacterium]|nr:YitT family protein [Lachnospiraceae bacterium]MDD3615269.1 YitT family protein [Lachnospiraceae bacterium]
MYKIKEKIPFWDYLLILVGTAAMAFAINAIFEPCGLVTGGFSGLAIIIKAVTGKVVEGGIPLWISNTVLNIPLFIIGVRIKGGKFMGKSIFGAIALSVWLAVFPTMDLVKEDLILASLFGGVVQGVGIGLVFMGNGTTGGTDTVAALIQHYLRHYSIAQIMQIVDGAVVAAGAFVFGVPKAMYAIIAIFIVSKISDSLIEGLKFAKAAYIITDRHEEVSHAIMHELDRGLTGIHAKGMYSQEEKTMLFCVVSKKQIVTLKELVGRVDPRAFIIVSDAREVLGEGFIEEMLRKC